MAEATDSVHLTNLRTRRQIAIAVIARRAAIRETKAERQRQGRKPATIHTGTSLRQRRAIYATTLSASQRPRRSLRDGRRRGSSDHAVQNLRLTHKEGRAEP